MGGLGFGELVLIVIILLVVFGGGKLPQLGDALGRAIRNFKRGATEDDRIKVTPKIDREKKTELPRSEGAGRGAVEDAEVEDAKVETPPRR